VSWKIVLTKQAVKDVKKIKASNLKAKAEKLIKVLQQNPYTPPFEKLTGDLKGLYSRRINIQHRLVYEILEEQKMVKIISLWTHYE
jgi:Txe/YoeB family toxin of toxin-antitoxin system